MTHINFTYRNKIEGCLSNMSSHPVMLFGKQFSMGEAAFHYAKYYIVANDPATDAARKKVLLTHADLFLVTGHTGPQYKSLGGKSKSGMPLTSAELQIWSRECDRVQLEICKYKLLTYAGIKSVLMKTTGIVLIHSCRTAAEKMSSEHWCGRMTDDGKIIGDNMLGKIWMSLRDG